MFLKKRQPDAIIHPRKDRFISVLRIYIAPYIREHLLTLYLWDAYNLPTIDVRFVPPANLSLRARPGKQKV